MMFTEKPADFNAKFNIVSCFLEHDGKFVLLQRQDHKPQGNTWGMPADKVEDGETPVAAMVRELKEETGYVAKESDLFLQHVVYVRYPEFDFVYYMFVLPLSKPYTPTIDPSSHKDFAWVAPQESLKKDLIPAVDECFKLHYHL